MTPALRDILEFIADGDADTIPGLADALGESRRSVESRIAKLCAAGLVKRGPWAKNPPGIAGGRARRWRLTPDGAAIANGEGVDAIRLRAAIERTERRLQRMRDRLAALERPALRRTA